jgi:hypothetical protein
MSWHLVFEGVCAAYMAILLQREQAAGSSMGST